MTAAANRAIATGLVRRNSSMQHMLRDVDGVGGKLRTYGSGCVLNTRQTAAVQLASVTICCGKPGSLLRCRTIHYSTMSCIPCQGCRVVVHAMVDI